MDAKTLAHLALTLLVADVAQRFMARTPDSVDDAGLIDRLVCMLAGR